jgi:Universal stress protein family
MAISLRWFAASVSLYEDFCQALRESGKRELQEFVKNHTPDEIQPELVVNQGMAPDSILAFAEAQKTDLIVMGTHGRRGFDRLMLGSVTERVLRTASWPVLAVCKPPHDLMTSGQQQHHVHHLSRIFLYGFLREFGAGFGLCDLCDSRVRRRAHPAARVGGRPKFGQDGRGHSDSDRATR